jgi:hypothetical protein
MYGTPPRLNTTRFGVVLASSASTSERSSGLLFKSISPRRDSTSASPTLRAAGISGLIVFRSIGTTLLV